MSDDLNLVERIETLERALELERSLNAVQQQSINQHIRQNRRNLDTLTAAALGLLGFAIVAIAGLNLEWEGGSFALPESLLQAGLAAITASGVSGGVVNMMNRAKGG